MKATVALTALSALLFAGTPALAAEENIDDTIHIKSSIHASNFLLEAKHATCTKDRHIADVKISMMIQKLGEGKYDDKTINEKERSIRRIYKDMISPVMAESLDDLMKTVMAEDSNYYLGHNIQSALTVRNNDPFRTQVYKYFSVQATNSFYGLFLRALKHEKLYMPVISNPSVQVDVQDKPSPLCP